jgi:phosphoglycerate dehydrogenase-like enzyme
VTKIVVDIAPHAEGLKRLEQLPSVEVTVLPRPTATARLAPSAHARELPTELAEAAEMLVCMHPPSNFGQMPRLRFVQLSSVGYAQLYGLDLPARGIRAANARGVYDTAIAEWNVAMMINLARDLRSMIRNQDQGQWIVEPQFANEIRTSIVGIWGYGGIGRETARLAKALGMKVHVLARGALRSRENFYCVAGTGDPAGKLPDRVFGPGQELEFLAGLDLLVLAMPLTPANKGRIGEVELRAMQPTAFLLNPARGPLVQEQALLRALGEGWIAGAALDTHYYYPMPPEHPLWQLPNVIMTPHISGSDKGPHFAARMWEIIVHNVTQFLAGQPLWNELTAAELNGA